MSAAVVVAAVTVSPTLVSLSEAIPPPRPLRADTDSSKRFVTYLVKRSLPRGLLIIL